MISLHALQREKAENAPLPTPCAIIRMADSADQFAQIKDWSGVVDRLDLVFNDASEPFQIVSPPSAAHGETIFRFVKKQFENKVPNLVFQCQVGIGRSHAAFAAVLKIMGQDPKPILVKGTYNRRLYRHILAAAGVTPDPEPLVSMNVRVKYDPERLHLFLLSMRRQRYENWEVVAVTDGPNPKAVELVRSIGDQRITVIETAESLGRWGHPHRQIGIDACRGEFIGMSNDDNYYVPGHLEQMMNVAGNADLILCRCLHSYFGWSMMDEGMDLGAWIARAALIRRLPWTGTEYTSDLKYLKQLKALAAGRIAEVKRPLFIHN